MSKSKKYYIKKTKRAYKSRKNMKGGELTEQEKDTLRGQGFNE